MEKRLEQLAEDIKKLTGPMHGTQSVKKKDVAAGLDDLLSAPWITLGMIHAGTGRAELALVDLQKALDRDPRSAAAHQERGVAQERLGRWDDAEASYRKAVDLRPQAWSAHNHLGAFLMNRSRFREAEVAFRKALESAPDNARVWSNLGGALYFEDRAREAEAAWTRALELAPAPTAAGNLAALQFSERRYFDAARTLEKLTETPHREAY